MLDRQEGLAPLDIELTIVNRGNAAFQRIEIDTNGDGTPETIVTTLPGNRIVESFSYPVPGTYTIRVKMYDVNNQVIYSTQRKVRAYGADELGYKIVGVYNNLLIKLGNNDATGALRMFTGNAAQRYYVEQLLAAGFHIAGVDVGAFSGSPAVFLPASSRRRDPCQRR